MAVRGVMISKDGQSAWGVLTNIRRTGPNGPIIEKMVSGAVTLNYQRHDRIWSHCLDGCRRAETGVIHLTQDSFMIAAGTGLPIRVFGRRGRSEGVVPPALFAAVLGQTNLQP